MRHLKTYLLKAFDAGGGALLCRIIASVDYWLRSEREVNRSVPDEARRILVIRPGGMGDMLLLLPMLRCLRERFPQAALELVCERRNLPVLQLADIERCAVAYDVHPFGLLWRLLRTRYDVAVDTEQFHHFSAIFARLSGAPVRIGFKINPVRNPLYTHLVNYAPDGPEGAQFMRLLEPLGIHGKKASTDGMLAHATPPPAPAVSDALHSAFGDGSFFALHPGAGAPYKRWAADRFADVATTLCREFGLGCVLIGDAYDKKAADAIAGRLNSVGCRAFSAAGRWTLTETASAIRDARLFLGTDSALAHLAVALGRPSVALFGATDPLKWGTQSDGHRTVHRDLPCAPCCIFGYRKPCRSIACMQSITVADVLTACRQVL